MNAVAAVTGDVWPPTHGRCTRVAGVICALCRCGRMLITHLPHNTASHPPKQQPLQVQGSKIGPSCCAFSVLGCLQSEGKIMVIMPKFSFAGLCPAPRWGSRNPIAPPTLVRTHIRRPLQSTVTRVAAPQGVRSERSGTAFRGGLFGTFLLPEHLSREGG